MKNTHTSIQFASFGKGNGFVLYKVVLPGRSGRFSAWFDAAGKLTSAEQITANNVARRATVQAMAELAPIGLRYVGIA